MQINSAKVKMLRSVHLAGTQLLLAQGRIYDATRATNQPNHLENGLWFVHVPDIDCTEDSILCSTTDNEIVFPVSPELQYWAKQARDVQNACNLSGVLHSMLEALQCIKQEYLTGWSTDDFNRHPIMVLFANKVLSLTGQWSSAEDDSFYKAWDECTQLMNGVSLEEYRALLGEL